MFEGFETRRIATEGAEIHLVMGGSGPPLALLHGYPQSHVAWHRVAPRLAESFTVVVPDLRGYGDSTGPEPDPGHQGYCKRAMAGDVAEVMAALGFERFGLAGHDRGGRVAYRLALDQPERVRRLAVLDMVPTLEMAERTDWAQALADYHWYFLAQPAPLPERLIGADPDFYLEHTIGSWLGAAGNIEAQAMAEYRRAFRRPSVIAAACADYRAGLTTDLAHDDADRAAGRRIACPLLALWGAEESDSGRHDYLAIWQGWADRATGRALQCGHFLMEEAPDETAAALAGFFAAGAEDDRAGG